MSKKTTIIKDGGRYSIYGDIGIADSLPSKVFEFKSGMFGAFLEDIGDIQMPDRVYSNDRGFIAHVLTTYSEMKTGSIGVLLSGNKGLGKSFTANLLCLGTKAPVIKVTSKPSRDDGLFSLLNRIQQEHVIFIDEFEKIFAIKEDKEDYVAQNDFLSFLDNGSVTTKRMFIITSNDTVSPYLINRPSRIRYHRKYEHLSVPVIREIVDDLLVDNSFRDDLIESIPQKEVNMDVLIKIIEEVNLHSKPYSEFKDFFNFSAGDYETFTIYDMSGNMIRDDEDIRVPLKKGYTLYWDERTEAEVKFQEILSQTRSELRVKTYRWRDEEIDGEGGELVYGEALLKRKYYRLDY